MAQTREDGSGSAGPERLRPLNDDRLAKPDARFQPGAARRPVAVAAPAVRAARFPVTPADWLPKLPYAARGAQLFFRQVAAVAATDPGRRGHPVVLDGLHAAVLLRPQDIFHRGA